MSFPTGLGIKVLNYLSDKTSEYFEKYEFRFVLVSVLLTDIPCLLWVGLHIKAQFNLIDFTIFGVLFLLAYAGTLVTALAIVTVGHRRAMADRVILSKDVFDQALKALESNRELHEWLVKVATGEADVQRVKYTNSPHPDLKYTLKFIPPVMRGRRKGSLSSSSLPVGTTIDDLIPFLRQAQRARDMKDGSFAQLCRDRQYPESTVRTWLDEYADIIRRD